QETLRLVLLLELGLIRLDVRGNGAQDLGRMVAQRERAHDLAGGKERGRKRFPLHQDVFEISGDEAGEAHASLLRLLWSTLCAGPYLLHDRLGLEAIACPENPPHGDEAQRQEQRRHPETDAHMHIGDLVEAPAKSAHEVDNGIEERDRLPGRREDADGVEGAAEEGQRRQDEERNELELLEAVRPEAEDEAEQAERDGDEDEEAEHP